MIKYDPTLVDPTNKTKVLTANGSLVAYGNMIKYDPTLVDPTSKTKVLRTHGSLMKVELEYCRMLSWSILQYF